MITPGQVKALILDSSIELKVLPKPEAMQLLSSNFPKCQDFAKSIDCSSLGLHLVHFNQDTFRTVAVQPVALPSSLKGVPWQIRAAARPGEFQLLGPSVALDAVVPGRFGKLGAQLPMQLGIQECNAAAAEGKQTNMALQAGLGCEAMTKRGIEPKWGCCQQVLRWAQIFVILNIWRVHF